MLGIPETRGEPRCAPGPISAPGPIHGEAGVRRAEARRRDSFSVVQDSFASFAFVHLRSFAFIVSQVGSLGLRSVRS